MVMHEQVCVQSHACPSAQKLQLRHITCIATATVGFDQQPVWSKQSGGEEEQWRQDKQWLEDLQAAELPPVATLLHDCLVQPVQEQVGRCRALKPVACGSWGGDHVAVG